MNATEPRVPAGHKLIGAIYWDDDLTILGEDMAEVELPCDVLVYSGWYGEGDPDGNYRIVATRNLEELERVTTRDVSEAVKLFEAMACKYA